MERTNTAQEERQLQVSIVLETLRSRVRFVVATLTSCAQSFTIYVNKLYCLYTTRVAEMQERYTLQRNTKICNEKKIFFGGGHLLT